MSECDHRFLKLDHFAKLAGVSRFVPGDCVCAKCHEPVAAWWNKGKPLPVTPTKAKGTS